MNSKAKYILVGLTASGKKSVGIRVAKAIGAEIISLDAIKVYRGMDIGSAKPSGADREAVPFHLLDLLEPRESFSVGRFLELADEAVKEIASRGRCVLFLGGTAFYLHALLHGLIQGLGSAPDLRRNLLERAEKQGAHALHAEMADLDPRSAEKIHPNDLKRIVRALEVMHLTGRQLSRLKEEKTRTLVSGPFRVAGLRRSGQDLETRIVRRTAKMIEKGLVEEVDRILAKEGFGTESGKAIGYREIIAYRNGEVSLEEAEGLINIATRRFTKKQMTWYKRFDQIRWFEVEAESDPETVARAVTDYFSENPRSGG